MRHILAAFMIALPIAAGAAPQNCGPRDKVTAHLEAKIGERRRGIGMHANARQVIEIYASAAGTWTITATAMDGTTCIVAAGSGYDDLSGDLPPNL
ncbi:hypothetical protein [Profundibacterium mesophilum]|uniref:PepSY domain-containing protein n=1 Tax=Profundibacterium mesophilum KAUST100406-0324 TaxID=1037889 RepID=A0A921NTT2_9RHOB|nr:hypothetical protein [Profundibacterium mesophilum]KAF0675056.1 hypothetical protein PMES_02577 [Profundibacterium mesophilum KAUST100406-0324]